MSHQLRIEDAGVAAVGNDGGGLAASRHVPGNPTAGTPTTTTEADSAPLEASETPKPIEKDTDKFFSEAMNFPGVDSPLDAREAWAERLFGIAEDTLRARGWTQQPRDSTTEQLRNDVTELKKMVAAIAKKQETPPKSWASVAASPNARPTGPKKSYLTPMGTQAFVPLRAERCLTVKLNGTPLSADQERRTASEIVQVINQKYKNADAKAITKLRLSGDYVITFGEEGRKWCLQHQAWVTHVFPKDATIAFRTVSVMVRGVPWALIDNLEPGELAKEMSVANKVNVARARAFRRKHGSERGSLLLEVTNADEGVRLTRDSLFWKGNAFHCEPFERDAIPQQCYNCWEFGHLRSYCPKEKEARCPRCAEKRHPGKTMKDAEANCPSNQQPDLAKCLPCNRKGHFAFSRDCPLVKAALGRSSTAFMERPREYAPREGPITIEETPAPSQTEAIQPALEAPQQPTTQQTQQELQGPERDSLPETPMRPQPPPTDEEGDLEIPDADRECSW